MLNRDDLARAARNADALVEEIGMEEFLRRNQVDKDGVLYMSEQRAMRMALIAEGRLHEIADMMARGRPAAIPLGQLGRTLMPSLSGSWMDGFFTGWLARHDSSHNIPGIDPNPKEASE